MTAAVVTGLGVMAPNGLGHREYWQAALRGESGIRPIERFDPAGYPARLAGEVRGLDPQRLIGSRLMSQTDPVTRLSLAAASWALEDARVDPAELPRYAAGVATASSAGGFEFGQRELQALWSKGPKHVSAYQAFAWFYAVNTGQISIRHRLHGPSGVVVTDQAGGLDAIANARRALRSGTALMVTGAVDSSLCPWAWIAHLAGGDLTASGDPRRAYRPFAADADGHVAGEGGAILVLEDAATAARRGAPSYGVIAGYAAGFDPRPGSGRPPVLARVIRAALADAGLPPGDVDVVFADAAGRAEADRAEAQALTEVFGKRGVAVTAPKSMTGRLYAGGAALDVATALLALRDQVVPPTVNVPEPPPEYGLDLVRKHPRPGRLRAALVLARGRGGFTSAMCVTAPPAAEGRAAG